MSIMTKPIFIHLTDTQKKLIQLHAAGFATHADTYTFITSLSVNI